MSPSPVEIVGAVLFALAVLHTFFVKRIERIGNRYPEGSLGENFFHFLGEVEAVFGIWAGIFLVYYGFSKGFSVYDSHHQLIFGNGAEKYLTESGGYIDGAINYLSALNFTEACFVFVIMTIAGTRPLIIFAEKAIRGVARVIPLPSRMAFYISCLVIGPLLGSFITEPAAMTVTALILLDYFYSAHMSKKFMYATIGLLFVNVSVGGTLTHFAAPPVLMVAGKWHWDTPFMLEHFGHKAAVAVLISTLIFAFIFRKELVGPLKIKQKHENEMVPPWWMTFIHLLFLTGVVVTSHHMTAFFGLFLFFLGFTAITKEYQDEIKLRESLLVGFFLAGLVVLGSMQAWWLRDVLSRLGDVSLFFGATGLTAITDNAALTYLGSLVDLSDSAKFNLVAGAVTGGGLTVIANAPNPAGYGILKAAFGDEGISPLYLLLGALLPTGIVILCMQLLP
jgi:predicted cation transporter